MSVPDFVFRPRLNGFALPLRRKTGPSSFTLKKVFKKYYGVSVFEFSREVRIEKAKELLLATNYTLQTIAETVGYTEGNNFQVAFKTVVGVTPGEWRRKNQSI